MATVFQLMTIRLMADATVSALLVRPEHAVACYVMAHGAGAGMTHPFMAAVATGLSERGVATLRYQFPYMERGSKRPDSPALAHKAVQGAVAAALGSRLPVFAGGKSFGGRMTSQAQAQGLIPGVAGLVFFGFPLHPAAKPSTARADHLATVNVPMLFLQGTRDPLAEMSLLAPMIAGLGRRATLFTVQDADHSFHVPSRSGSKDAEVMAAMLDTAASWMQTNRSAVPEPSMAG